MFRSGRAAASRAALRSSGGCACRFVRVRRCGPAPAAAGRRAAEPACCVHAAGSGRVSAVPAVRCRIAGRQPEPFRYASGRRLCRRRLFRRGRIGAAVGIARNASVPSCDRCRPIACRASSPVAGRPVGHSARTVPNPFRSGCGVPLPCAVRCVRTSRRASVAHAKLSGRVPGRAGVSPTERGAGEGTPLPPARQPVRREAAASRRRVLSVAYAGAEARRRCEALPAAPRAGQCSTCSSSFLRMCASMSSVMRARSHSGFQPHSSRAQVSSSESGQLSAISFLTGSMS